MFLLVNDICVFASRKNGLGGTKTFLTLPSTGMVSSPRNKNDGIFLSPRNIFPPLRERWFRTSVCPGVRWLGRPTVRSSSLSFQNRWIYDSLYPVGLEAWWSALCRIKFTGNPNFPSKKCHCRYRGWNVWGDGRILAFSQMFGSILIKFWGVRANLILLVIWVRS